MSRYYFEIRNGFGFTPDEEGRELGSDEEAREEALRGARSLLSAEVMQGRLDLRGGIEVSDEGRRPVLAVRFSEAVVIVQGNLPTGQEGGSGT